MTKTDKIIEEWSKKHKWDYDCYKEQIQELKDEINKEAKHEKTEKK